MRKTLSALIISLILWCVGCSLSPIVPEQGGKPTDENTQKLPDSSSLSGEIPRFPELISDKIRSIAADKNSVWIGTDRGVSRLIKADGRWIHYTQKDGLANDDVRDIVVDGTLVWFATGEGVSRYDMTSDLWRTFRKTDGLASDDVNCAAVDGHYVWFGTDRGLNRYDKQIDSWAVRTKKDGLPSNNITTIAVDQDYIWVGMGKEKVIFDRDRRFFGRMDEEPQGGVGRYHRATDSWNSYSIKDGLVGGEISEIAVDEDVVWFGTKEFGVSVFSKVDQAFIRTYTKTDFLSSDMIRAIMVDGNQVWFGTANGGAQRYIKSVNTWINYTSKDGLPSDHITCIAVDGNDVWFGTYGDGVARFNKINGKWTIYSKADQLPDTDVRQIARDVNGNIWAATPNGLAMFSPDDAHWHNFNRKDGLPSEFITSVAASEEGIWIGTERGLGFRPIARKDWSFIGKIGEIRDFYVNSIMELNGEIWVATNRGLAHRTTDGTWHLIERTIDKPIRTISHDGQSIWIGANDGLYVYAPASGTLVKKSESTVTAITCAGDRVFIGTEKGVLVVAGDTVEKLISDVVVSALSVIGNDLWIGTPTGLIRSNLSASGSPLPIESIPYSIRTVLDSGDSIYLATDVGIVEYDPNSGKVEVKRSVKDSSPLLGFSISNIEFDGDYIWMSNWEGTVNGCILRYHRPSDTWRRFTRFDILKDPKQPSHKQVRRIVIDGNFVWVSTDEGLIRYDKRCDTWLRITKKDGLVSNTVNLVVPTEKTVWVTYDSINDVTRIQKDGLGMETFSLKDEPAWSGITCVSVDGENVWVGTNMSLWKYEGATGEWRKYTVKDGLGSNGTEWIDVDDRYIWVAAGRRNYSRALSRYDKQLGKWESFSTADVLSSDSISRVVATPERVWIIYQFYDEAGITQYDRKNDEWITITPKGEWGSGVTEVCEDEDYLWLGTVNSGVMRFHIASGTWTSFDANSGLLHNHVNNRALKSDDRYVWVGTPLGLSRYDKVLESWKQFRPRKSLLGKEVRTIAIDDRYVWVGTTSGLSRYDTIDGSWENYRQSGGRQELRIGGDRWSWYEPPLDEGLVNNWISCLAVDERYVWIGTREGANRYDKIADKWDKYERENGLPGEDISSIAIAGSEVWMGTNNGIGKFPLRSDNPNAWVSYTSGIEIKPGIVSKEFAETLVSDEVWCMAVDDKFVWVGTRMGVSRYDKRRDLWRTLKKEDGLPDNRISCIATDGRKVWFGSDEGVAVHDTETLDWQIYTTEDGLVSNKVTCITLDGDLVWFGTYDSGISVFDTVKQSWRKYDKTDGLSHNSIYAIAIKGDNVWVGTQRGLSRLNKSTGVWTVFTETHWTEDL